MEEHVQAATELRRGTYSNVAIIRHMENEFVFDFGLVVQDRHLLVSRVILSPDHVKRLHAALGINLEKFEEAYGKIQIKDNAPKKAVPDAVAE